LAKNVVAYLKACGYKVKARIKALSVNNKDYEVLIQVVWNNTEPVAEFMPDFVSPHRPYPICAYIFAIAFYELTPKMTQRQAAEFTRNIFGLGAKKFSASTLCRARKKLIEYGADIFNALKDDVAVGTIKKEQPAAPEEFDRLINEGGADITDTYGCKYSPPDSTKPGLNEVLAAFPGLVEFIDKVKKVGALLSDKVNFAASIGQASQKYFLLNRRLII